MTSTITTYSQVQWRMIHREEIHREVEGADAHHVWGGTQQRTFGMTVPSDFVTLKVGSTVEPSGSVWVCPSACRTMPLPAATGVEGSAFGVG